MTELEYPEKLGRCECINSINKSVILKALGKEDARLFTKINMLRQNGETPDKEFVDTLIQVLQKHRNYIDNATTSVIDTPECKR